MQLMPATGQSLKAGDITVTESNVHGGAKYVDQLMTRYFKDAKFDEQNRTLFAFASYNVVLGNISKMRREAEKRGLDPDVRFNNVEVVTAEKIGIETRPTCATSSSTTCPTGSRRRLTCASTN
jgi:membrane-bound lytic murein transglycosylase MltF